MSQIAERNGLQLSSAGVFQAPGETPEFNYSDGQSVEVRLRDICLLYTSPSPRDLTASRMPSSA